MEEGLESRSEGVTFAPTKGKKGRKGRKAVGKKSELKKRSFANDSSESEDDELDTSAIDTNPLNSALASWGLSQVALAERLHSLSSGDPSLPEEFLQEVSTHQHRLYEEAQSVGIIKENDADWLMKSERTMAAYIHTMLAKNAQLQQKTQELDAKIAKADQRNIELLGQLTDVREQRDRNEARVMRLEGHFQHSEHREQRLRGELDEFIKDKKFKEAINAQTEEFTDAFRMALGQARIKNADLEGTKSATSKELSFLKVLITLANALEIYAGTNEDAKDHKARAMEMRTGVKVDEVRRVMIAPVDTPENAARLRTGADTTTTRHVKKQVFLPHALGKNALKFAELMQVDLRYFAVGNKHEIYRNAALTAKDVILSNDQINVENERTLEYVQRSGGANEHFLIRKKIGNERIGGAVLVNVVINGKSVALVILTGGYYSHIEIAAIRASMSAIYENELTRSDANIELDGQMATINAIRHRDVAAYIKTMLSKDKTFASQATDLADMTTFRSVTVAFIDVVSSTQLSTRIDSKDSALIMEGFFRAINKHLRSKNKYASVVPVKTLGDAMMLVTGAPMLCPNHAQLMLETMVDFIRHCVPRIRLRSEIDDFDVTVSMFSGNIQAILRSSFEFDIYGQASNFANRISKRAGQLPSIKDAQIKPRILISDETIEQLKKTSDFNFSDLDVELHDCGKQEFKGSKHPLQVYGIELKQNLLKTPTPSPYSDNPLSGSFFRGTPGSTNPRKGSIEHAYSPDGISSSLLEFNG